MGMMTGAKSPGIPGRQLSEIGGGEFPNSLLC